MDHHESRAMEQEVFVDINLSVEGNEDNRSVDYENIDGSRKKGWGTGSSGKKPPRPQRSVAFCLDQKEKEIAMIKKAARIERMNKQQALIIMQMQQQKKPPISISSKKPNYTTFISMLFTILVFIVILFQGMSCQISCEGHETNENGLIFIHQQLELNPSAAAAAAAAHDSV